MSNNHDLPEQAKERLRGIYERHEYSSKVFKATWLPDSKRYMVSEPIPESGQQSLVVYHAANHERSVIFNPVDFFGNTEKVKGITIDNYDISKDGRIVFVRLNKAPGNNEKIYVTVDLNSGNVRKIIGGEQNWISPGGERNIFSKNGNLYLFDSRTDSVVAITTDGLPAAIANGQVSWSPDGQSISFVQTNQSKVRLRTWFTEGDPSFPEIIQTRFARVGETIATSRIGIMDMGSRTLRWVPLAMPYDGFYLGQISWSDNSRILHIEKLNRFRTHREFLSYDKKSGSLTCVFEEDDPDWVVASYNKNGGMVWNSQLTEFIFLSEKDGWRHAYKGFTNRKDPLLLTSGDFDIIEHGTVDHKHSLLYYYASPDNGTQKYLYRTSLDGRSKSQRVTPLHQSGTHEYIFSPDAQWAFHTYSNSHMPPVTDLIKLPEHKTVRVLEENKVLNDRQKKNGLPTKEFFEVDIGDGIHLDGWMIKPFDFDSSKKYPLFVYVYGEPHAQTVLDVWEHAYTSFHQVIADLGYIVVSIDNRGTPCPKGAAWRRSVSGSLGPLSTEEQAAGVVALSRQVPYIDVSRVGVWGWSGGGSNTLNALFRKPDIFKVGIAVAPKPQPWLYNAWFQEIYMKTPAVNPEGYRQSAPIHFAEGLKGDLLIIHGSGETNTHIQITEGLVDRLIALGKPFDYFTYPNRDHGLSEGMGTSLHLRTMIVRYLVQHLPAGPG